MSTETKIDKDIPDFETLEIVDFPALDDKTHHDQYVEYSHELSEDSAEATSRALVRFVPLAYGGLLGGLTEAMPLGILGGMGPVNELHSDNAKWFSALYALYSGVALLTIVAAMLTPTIHRLLHKLHLDHSRLMHHTRSAQTPPPNE